MLMVTIRCLPLPPHFSKHAKTAPCELIGLHGFLFFTPYKLTQNNTLKRWLFGGHRFFAKKFAD